MKKNKITAVFMASLFFVLTITGCGSNTTTSNNEQSTPSVEVNSIGTAVLAQFYTEVSSDTDINSIAESLSQNDVFTDIEMVTMEISEGYLNGFDDEISGFSSGIMFAPMIGTIPFIGYVFESDSPDMLVLNLKNHAMMNWNICTVADEMVVEAYGDYVLFVLAPNEF